MHGIPVRKEANNVLLEAAFTTQCTQSNTGTLV